MIPGRGTRISEDDYMETAQGRPSSESGEMVPVWENVRGP
jgi:hypothetical protein